VLLLLLLQSTCDAKERSDQWMVLLFEQCTREEDGDYDQSQGSLSSFCDKDTGRKRLREYPKRETAIQILIENQVGGQAS
jgi:hypothetical protein